MELSETTGISFDLPPVTLSFSVPAKVAAIIVTEWRRSARQHGTGTELREILASLADDAEAQAFHQTGGPLPPLRPARQRKES